MLRSPLPYCSLMNWLCWLRGLLSSSTAQLLKEVEGVVVVLACNYYSSDKLSLAFIYHGVN